MSTEFLTTTLHVPPAPRPLVERQGLLEMLEREVPAHRLVLLSAPAGYGKTTLLAQWVHQSRYPVVWYAPGPEDDDPDRFFAGLVAGWSLIQPEILDTPLKTVLAGMAPDPEETRAAFINAGNTMSEHTVFLIDDIQSLQDERVLRSLSFVLDHLPPALHVILSGREMPPIPMARYLARGELLRLGVDALRFSFWETATFLRMVTGEDPPERIVAALHERLEGWVAGVRLASLSLQAAPLPDVSPRLTGRHQLISDYIREDVLTYLPEDQAWFLLQTSILDRLGESVCNAVTGREDSQEMLRSLERANLFLDPLDEDREWYRYHPLFADVLREELARRAPDVVAGLHSRAARWHLGNGLPEEALRLGVREGYVRVFIDLGLPMSSLLQEVRARNLVPDSVLRLLVDPGERARDPRLLPEPLTPREVEVLHHVSAGQTNEEVGKALFISPETVKKHASSIFGKLGVGNRTEAAARARKLGLLSDH